MTTISDFDPETHADPPTFVIGDANDVGDFDRSTVPNPEPLVHIGEDLVYAPEGTDAAEWLKSIIETREATPDHDEYDHFVEKWQHGHETELKGV